MGAPMISRKRLVFNEIGKRLPVSAKAYFLGQTRFQRDFGLWAVFTRIFNLPLIVPR
jgi:hypothetical protein